MKFHPTTLLLLAATVAAKKDDITAKFPKDPIEEVITEVKNDHSIFLNSITTNESTTNDKQRDWQGDAHPPSPIIIDEIASPSASPLDEDCTDTEEIEIVAPPPPPTVSPTKLTPKPIFRWTFVANPTTSPTSEPTMGPTLSPSGSPSLGPSKMPT